MINNGIVTKMLYVISGLLCGLYWRLIRVKQKRETRIWLKKHPEYVAQREEVYRKWVAALKEREEQELAEMKARVAELEVEMDCSRRNGDFAVVF